MVPLYVRREHRRRVFSLHVSQSLRRGFSLTDEHYKALRTLILDQSVKIEALTMEVRALRAAVETTEVVYLGADDMDAMPIDVPEDVKKFLPD